MAHRDPPDSGTALLVESYPQLPATTLLDALAAIPEEQVWLASPKSPQTRRAYRQDVEHFMRMLGIRSADELPRVNHKAVLAWEAYMGEFEHVEASTVRRRLAALSSLFKHLIRRGVADRNPGRDVERPPINRREGFTPAFSKAHNLTPNVVPLVRLWFTCHRSLENRPSKIEMSVPPHATSFLGPKPLHAQSEGVWSKKRRL